MIFIAFTSDHATSSTLVIMKSVKTFYKDIHGLLCMIFSLLKNVDLCLYTKHFTNSSLVPYNAYILKVTYSTSLHCGTCFLFQQVLFHIFFSAIFLPSAQNLGPHFLHFIYSFIKILTHLSLIIDICILLVLS